MSLNPRAIDSKASGEHLHFVVAYRTNALALRGKERSAPLRSHHHSSQRTGVAARVKVATNGIPARWAAMSAAGSTKVDEVEVTLTDMPYTTW
jgi:hypothetical protein